MADKCKKPNQKVFAERAQEPLNVWVANLSKDSPLAIPGDGAAYLICDLLHLCVVNGWDHELVLAQALEHFNDENPEECDDYIAAAPEGR